jgi:hypothetical protein
MRPHSSLALCAGFFSDSLEIVDLFSFFPFLFGFYFLRSAVAFFI